jgi:hypothetical protein
MPANRCGRALEDVGLRALEFGDRGFQSRCENEGSLVFVCCEGSGLCDYLIPLSDESYGVCVCV